MLIIFDDRHSGYVDSIMAAKENSLKFGYPISANRELVALGESTCELQQGLCTDTMVSQALPTSSLASVLVRAVFPLSDRSRVVGK